MGVRDTKPISRAPVTFARPTALAKEEKRLQQHPGQNPERADYFFASLNILRGV